MKRLPHLKVLKPRGLEMQRAKATTTESVKNYYTELEKTLTKYDLKHKPECICNVNEAGLSTMHKPPSVVAAVGFKPPAVLSGLCSCYSHRMWKCTWLFRTTVFSSTGRRPVSLCHGLLSVVRLSVLALTFSLNIFSETTYQILIKFHRNVPTIVLFRIS